MKQLTLRRKIKFLDYAISYYSSKKDFFHSICILFVDTWLKRPDLLYDKTVDTKFPELWEEIEKVLKRIPNDRVIHYKNYCGGRILLLKRVKEDLL